MSTVASTSSAGNTYNAVFTTEKENMVSVDDFLTLMVEQLKNQDFLNPVDDTEYLSQLAQFASMQQMQELAAYSKYSYVASLVGKNVTVAKFTVSGAVQKDTGPIEKISLVDDEYLLYVNGNSYTLSQIMQINQTTSSESGSKIDPSNLAIEVSEITSNSAALSWPKPSTDTTITDELTYSLYYSTDSAIDTVEEIESNGELIGEPDRSDLTSESLKGLDPDTTYYVNVVVTDGDGNKYAYQKSTFHTLSGTEEE